MKGFFFFYLKVDTCVVTTCTRVNADVILEAGTCLEIYCTLIPM